MILAQDLWRDQSWELPDDEAAWAWAQEHTPEAMLRFPKTTEDLIEAVNHLQNYQMLRQGHPETEPVVLPFVVGVIRAAKLLARHPDQDDPAWRAARVLHEGDDEAAALAACEVPVTEENRKMLRGLLAVQPTTKAEATDDDKPTGDVEVLAHDDPEAAQVGEALQRAVDRGALERPVLEGHPKHSAGTWLAHDAQTMRSWLLKPDLGGQSPAAGAREEAASEPRREVAARHALAAMGLKAWTPRADLVRLAGKKEYAAEAYLGQGWHGAADEDSVVLQHRWHPLLVDGTLHTLAAALWVLGDPDAHSHNILVRHGDELQLIDFGSALCGDSFDPGRDPNSFTPFLLRVWAHGEYGKMAPEERLGKLPRLSRDAEGHVRTWAMEIDIDRLESSLTTYGVNPDPTLRRLRALQVALLGQPADEAVNRAWTVGL